MIKYISIFRMVLGCLLVARKENLTGFSTGLTSRSKNLNPTGRSTRSVPFDPTGFHLWWVYTWRPKSLTDFENVILRVSVNSVSSLIRFFTTYSQAFKCTVYFSF